MDGCKIMSNRSDTMKRIMPPFILRIRKSCDICVHEADAVVFPVKSADGVP